jgi:ATP-dependent helicase/nuclease subunit A
VSLKQTDQLRQADHAARQLARSEFLRPLALEAGAGTGKTATLVQRILCWCLGPGWSRHAGQGPGTAQRLLRRLVAITFTEAAAAEMAERIGAGFRAVAAGRSPIGLAAGQLAAELGLSSEQLAERAQACVQEQEHLRVATIHGFAAEILFQHPLEAGLHPRPTIDADGERLRRTAREELHARLAQAYGEPPDPDWLALARKGLGPAEIEAELIALASQGAKAQDLQGEPLSPARWALREQAWLKHSARLLPELEQLLPSVASNSKVKSALTALRAAAGILESPSSPAEKLTALRLLEPLDKLVNALKEWKSGKFAAREAFADERLVSQAAGELLGEIKTVQDFDANTLGAAQRVLGGLLAGLRQRLEQQGVLGFDDLLTRAVQLLEADPDLTANLRGRLDQLLVDEFQDTDQRQCRLVTALALSGPIGTRPGLFVVGDPKQSIYAWRQADLAAYERFLEGLVAAGGTRAPLAINYRSNAAILEEVAAVHGNAMRAMPGLQPGFVALVTPAGGAAESTAPPLGRAAVTLLVAEGPAGQAEHATAAAEADEIPGRTSGRGAAPAQDTPPAAAESNAAPLRRSERTRREAEAFAREARELESSGQVRFREMALLLRSTSDQERYLEALRQAGVPYLVARDRSYYRRREVIDAAAWVRLCLDPTDQVALVTWARSPAVGVPDGALLPLWQARLPECVQALAKQAPAARLKAAEQLLSTAQRQLSVTPGSARIAHWPASLLGGLLGLGELQAQFQRLPADRFVELLRRTSLAEIGEGARFLGHFGRANLERFFALLEAQLESTAGDVERLVGALKDAVLWSRDAEEARPPDPEQDALQVLTVHKAKGLDFKVVFLGQAYKSLFKARPGARQAEFAQTPKGAEFRLFGRTSLGFQAVEAQRAAEARAEAVRLLYVAQTRAKARLVIGCEAPWLAPEQNDPQRAESFEQLIALRGPWPTELHADGRAPLAPGVELACLPKPVDSEQEPQDAEAGPARSPRHRAGAQPAPGLPRGAALLQESERRGLEAQGRARRPLLAPASSDGSATDRSKSPGALPAGPVRLDGDSEVARERERDSDLRDKAEALQGATEDGAAQAPQAGRAPAEARGFGARSRGSAASLAALEVGTRLHALLEHHGPGDLANGRFESRAGELLERLEAELGGPARDLALARAAALLEALRQGPLLSRLEALAPQVIARELPLFIPPDASDGPEQPLAAYSGTIDLLYAAGDTWVIADFKTDRSLNPESSSEHLGHYRRQLGRYARAVQQALGRPNQSIAMELWWLERGAIQRL